MDLLKSTINGIVAQQKAQAAAMQESYQRGLAEGERSVNNRSYQAGYKRGYEDGKAEGITTARKEFEKSLLEFEGGQSKE